MVNNNSISDELLAAFLDGNVNESEACEVLNAVDSFPELSEVLDIALDVEECIPMSYDILPMMRYAAESGNNICSILCEAYILNRREVPFLEHELLDLAQKNHWLTPQGSPLHSIGQLLAHYGLMVTRKYDANIQDIHDALASDNDVIVAVDSDKLYYGREDLDDAPNHAVVVTKIDATTEIVTIFDPQDNSELSLPVARFVQAWKMSHCYMVRVLQTIEDYEPHPINLDAIQLTDDLIDLREAIAENAHEVWAAARKKEGWTYGKERDDANKKHPDLIPYSSLPDSEKEYDRLMALDTIKLVKKLGFEIVKRK